MCYKEGFVRNKWSILQVRWYTLLKYWQLFERAPLAVLRHKIDVEINRIPIRLTDSSVTGTRKYRYGNVARWISYSFLSLTLQRSRVSLCDAKLNRAHQVTLTIAIKRSYVYIPVLDFGVSDWCCQSLTYGQTMASETLKIFKISWNRAVRF